MYIFNRSFLLTRRELDGEAFHDGGFWIGYQDFLKYFDTIDFCHINKDEDKEVVFNGRWEVGLNAGGVQKGDFKNYAKNPQCFIELRSPNRADPENLCSAVIRKILAFFRYNFYSRIQFFSF
jgi:calpain